MRHYADEDEHTHAGEQCVCVQVRIAGHEGGEWRSACLHVRALAASLSAVELRRICQRRAVGRDIDDSGINGKRAI